MHKLAEQYLRSELDGWLKKPFQAMVLEAVNAATRKAAVELLTKELAEDHVQVLPDGPSIKLAQVASLYKRTIYKKDARRLLVTIHEAGLMTLPAQNVLLKLLEEPPEDVYFLLTVDRADSLLPTIRSRAQLATVKGLSHDKFLSLLTGTNSADELERRFILSHGDPVAALVDIQATDSIQEAKKLVGNTLFLGLSQLNQSNVTKAEALSLVKGLLTIAEHTVKRAQSRSEARQSTMLAGATLTAHSLILQNVTPKLVLARLLLAWRRSPIL